MTDIKLNDYFYFIVDCPINNSYFNFGKALYRSYKAKIQKTQDGRFEVHIRYYDDIVTADSNEEVLLKLSIYYGKQIFKLADYAGFAVIDFKKFKTFEDARKLFVGAI